MLVTHCPYLNDLTRTKPDPDTEHSSPPHSGHSSIIWCVDFNLCVSTSNAAHINYSKLPIQRPRLPENLQYPMQLW